MKKKFFALFGVLMLAVAFIFPCSTTTSLAEDTPETSSYGTSVSKTINIEGNQNSEDDDVVLTLQFLDNYDNFISFDTNGTTYTPANVVGAPENSMTAYLSSYRETSTIHITITQKTKINSLVNDTSTLFNLKYYDSWAITQDGDTYSYTFGNYSKEQSYTITVTDNTISNGSVKIDHTLGLDEDDYGAGIYYFTYTIPISGSSNSITESLYVYITPDELPTYVENETLELKVEESGLSSQGFFHKYKVSIDSDDFTYVNKNKITWHVVGEDTNKQKYVYSKEDWNAIEDEETREKYEYLFTNPEQNMLIFEFNPSAEGTWQVYATMEIDTDNDGNTETIKTKTITIETIKIKETHYLITLLIILGVVICISLIIGVVAQIKREKVY